MLLRLGSWLARNGEAVYATRAWKVYGEGPTPMGSDHFSDMVTGTAADIRYTRSKDSTILYATILGWPESGQVSLHALSAGNARLDKLTSVHLIGTSKTDMRPLAYQQDNEGMHITLPVQAPIAQEAYVIRLAFQDMIP